MNEPVESETLAGLYLAQGFPERALGIYERLLESQPASASLVAGRDRCRAAIADRRVEDPMDPNQRLQVLQDMLQRLTGEVPAQRPRTRPAPAGSGVVRPHADAEPAPAIPTDPTQQKIEILQAMLARLGRA